IATSLPFVISTGAERSGEICGLLFLTAAADRNEPPLCHLDRSGEICGLLSLDRRRGPQRASPLSSRPERSGVERSAVCFPLTAAADRNEPPLCHLDRSGEICGLLSLDRCRGSQRASPLSSRPERRDLRSAFP